MAYAILDAYKANDSFEKAVNKFNEVVGIFPTQSWPWHVLGELYKAKGEHEKAIQVYQSALEHIPLDYSFRIAQGNVYLDSHDHPRALDSFNGAIEAAPNGILWAYLPILTLEDFFFPDLSIDGHLAQLFLWYSIGEAHVGNHNYAAATEIYHSAILYYTAALQTKRNKIWWVRTGVEIDRFQPDEFRQKIQLSEPFLWSALAEAYKKKGDISAAIKAFKKAQTLKPDNPWLKSVICELKKVVETSVDMIDC